jgi:hypothetical protein
MVSLGIIIVIALLVFIQIVNGSEWEPVVVILGVICVTVTAGFLTLRFKAGISESGNVIFETRLPFVKNVVLPIRDITRIEYSRLGLTEYASIFRKDEARPAYNMQISFYHPEVRKSFPHEIKSINPRILIDDALQRIN